VNAIPSFLRLLLKHRLGDNWENNLNPAVAAKLGKDPEKDTKFLKEATIDELSLPKPKKEVKTEPGGKNKKSRNRRTEKRRSVSESGEETSSPTSSPTRRNDKKEKKGGSSPTRNSSFRGSKSATEKVKKAFGTLDTREIVKIAARHKIEKGVRRFDFVKLAEFFEAPDGQKPRMKRGASAKKASEAVFSD
jgi:hypothetical protein